MISKVYHCKGPLFFLLTVMLNLYDKCFFHCKHTIVIGQTNGHATCVVAGKKKKKKKKNTIPI